MKPKYLSVIILAVVAAGASAVYYARQPVVDNGPVVINHDTKTQSPATTTPDSNLKDWKTYMNMEYGFEFKYPPYFFRPILTEDDEMVFQTNSKTDSPDEKLSFTVFKRSDGFHMSEYFFGCEKPNLNAKPGCPTETGSTNTIEWYVSKDSVLIDSKGEFLVAIKASPEIIKGILSTFKFASPQTAEVNKEVSLKIGDTAQVDAGLSLKLVSVADSRCPSDVQCVWAGTVTATAELFKNTTALGRADVEINKNAKIGDYTIAFTKVLPMEKNQETQKSDYVLTFTIQNN